MKRLLTLIYAIILTLIFFGCAPIENKDNSQKPGTENTIKTESIDQNLDSLEKAKVVRVVDGDTVIVSVNGVEEKIRLVLVNTPESTTKKEPYGKEASDYTKKVLKVGREVYLEKDVSDRDQYGRLLRYLWLEQPTNINSEEIRTKMFNASLLTDGYAMVSTFPPDVKYQEVFVNLQREARENKTGLWSLKEYSKNLDDNKIVFYTKNGKSYHFSKSCKSLEKSKNILSGKLGEVMDIGKVDPCNLCTK
ncbi:MAG: thermonuclease family protein [Clostridium sp.]